MSTDTLTIWALHGQEVTDTGSTPGASVYRGRREDLPFGGWTSQGYAVERVEQLTVSPEQARALGVEPSETKARDMLAELGHTGNRQRRRVEKLAAVLREHPDAGLEGEELLFRVTVTDAEGLVPRPPRAAWGRAQCRADRCALIGVSDTGYIWAVWPASKESTP